MAPTGSGGGALAATGERAPCGAISFVLVLAQCKELTVPLQLDRFVLHDASGCYRSRVLLDDEACLGRCQALARPGLECVGASEIPGGRSLMTDWRVSWTDRPSVQSSRPDVLHALALPEVRRARSVWMLEMDAIYVGPLVELIDAYERTSSLASLDFVGAGTPKPVKKAYFQEAFGDFCVGSLERAGYSPVFKAENFVSRFSRRLVDSFLDAQ